VIDLHWVEVPPKGSKASTVVFLHGLGSSAEDWFFQTGPISNEHRVVAVDLPGHGRTPPFDGWPRIEDYAASVAAALESHEVDSAHVVGLSLGGAVALELGLDRPGLVRSLTLINTFARMKLTPAAWLRGSVRLALLLSGQMDRLGNWVAAGLFPHADQDLIRRQAAGRIASTPRRGYLQSIAAARRFGVERRLGEIGVPTLVVAGSRDRTVPPRAGRALAAGIPGARLEVIEGAGHVASVDSADRVNELLLDFLREVDSS
jgi:pimeloyl-ACP methyl ester carboxylesterase